ncbi:hypothetical protein [Streptomyces spectabilis]|uniref:DNA-directed RNA polymerase subunit RPC12/RpoP n=1 Tax=Streptomyces spectabilis TaxID=68270 RepID=A0A7W8B2W8_STRST|nr:hypothetical protein [Streptomyces spectabilis]MBB5109306.1 DNA-directed RNA polymerase subunit RPC12/RpoP [Streptomyces spectabilis]GGV52344.1 hypothetical protein GCM10010245_82350 [Streptomyces spectabilis]
MHHPPQVISWYRHKTYQCPHCRHDTVAEPSRWVVFTCCNCSTRFTCFPRLQRLLRHAGVTCEVCTERHPVPVDGEPFGYLRRRHTGVGGYAPDRFEAWVYDAEEVTAHRDGVRYLNSRPSRAEAMTDLAHWRSMFGPVEDDLSSVLAVVADEEFFRYGPHVSEEHQAGFLEGVLEVYGVGALRAYLPPHPRHGQFRVDSASFAWGLIAPSGLEGIYTRTAPRALAAHAPQL